MKFEIEADIPEGYEPTGEYRRPRHGDLWLDGRSCVRQCKSLHEFFSYPHLILRKIEPPKPVYRAWKDRSEVPIGLRFLRPINEEHPGDATWFAVQCLLSTNEITMSGGYCRSFDSLLNAWEWSFNGRDWHPCGVLQS